MQNAPQPAALRDRAERHVFGTLPGLPAIERRALAVVELTDGDRALAARDTGLDGEVLRTALARGRKALRRTRAPLAAGGRCEDAELLLSDELDAALEWRGRRWLAIHMDRCARCREHEQLLGEARAALVTAFVVGETERERPRPKPAAPMERPDERAQLRVVPPPAPPEPPPAVEPPAPAAEPAARAPLPAPAPKRAIDPARRAAAARAAKIVAAVLVVAALLAAIGFGISQLGGGDDQQSAPWDRPDAPVVHPAPLSGQ